MPARSVMRKRTCVAPLVGTRTETVVVVPSVAVRADVRQSPQLAPPSAEVANWALLMRSPDRLSRTWTAVPSQPDHCGPVLSSSTAME